MKNRTEAQTIIDGFILDYSTLSPTLKLAVVHEIAIDGHNFPDGEVGRERKNHLLDLLQLDPETLNHTDVSGNGMKITILQQLLSDPISADKDVVTYLISHGAIPEITLAGSRMESPSRLLQSMQTDYRFAKGIAADLTQAFMDGGWLAHDEFVAHASAEKLSVSVVPSAHSKKLDQLIQTVSGGRIRALDNMASVDGNAARYVSSKGKTVFHAIIEGDQSWEDKKILVREMAQKIKTSLIEQNEVSEEHANTYLAELLAHTSKPTGLNSKSEGSTVLHKLAGEFHKVCAEQEKRRLSTQEAQSMKNSMQEIADTLLKLSPGLERVRSTNGRIPLMIVDPMGSGKMILLPNQGFDKITVLEEEQTTTKRKSIFGFGVGSKTTPQSGIKGGNTTTDSKLSSLAYTSAKGGNGRSDI